MKIDQKILIKNSVSKNWQKYKKKFKKCVDLKLKINLTNYFKNADQKVKTNETFMKKVYGNSKKIIEESRKFWSEIPNT